jgi:NitT/TauT family transport system permease protein
MASPHRSKRTDCARSATGSRRRAADPFRDEIDARQSSGIRAARRIGWNLLPPLTFVAMVGLWWAASSSSRYPLTCCPARQRVSRGW